MKSLGILLSLVAPERNKFFWYLLFHFYPVGISYPKHLTPCTFALADIIRSGQLFKVPFLYLQDMLPILAELRHALLMQVSLENHVNKGNFSKVGFLFLTCLKDITLYFPSSLLQLTLILFFSMIFFLPDANLIFLQAFQVLSEYLQLLDSLSELSVIQEMSRGVEVRIQYLLDTF